MHNAAFLFKHHHHHYYFYYYYRDSGSNGYVSLKITNTTQEGGDLLWIDNNGVIRVKQTRTEFGNTNVLTYILEATDGGQPPLRDHTTLTVVTNSGVSGTIRFA